MALVVTKGTAFPEGKREEEAGEVVVAGQHINSHIIGLLTKKANMALIDLSCFWHAKELETCTAQSLCD